ncbi:MAG: AAA family ATPase [Alphaproteobacteria bacterium]|nr:AAA family ATPase [Alphaproteobacteria bacterium]MDA8003324.1 AAA family ATPase [Alphaproteobacteria bacterium]MDA8005335.1 AAA family ATPase [Alphaproteobacteria bacterium]MDA8012609.1 AAA family ATPase [Alphaproteobacteria bacterium]
MQIKRFLSIKNIGRLVDCKQHGPELDRYNLFFAENGRGKTTLCAVLRSLQTGEHEYITGRTTVPPNADGPEVSILLDIEDNKEDTTYKEQSWSRTVPEIMIFDATFVARNVHAGEYVSRDQRTNLLQVIIGEKDISLAAAVADIDRDIRSKNSEIDQSRKAIQEYLPQGVKFEQFLNLGEDPEIDDKIAKKSKDLEAGKRVEEIKKRSTPAEAKIPVLPNNFETVLAKTLTDVATDAETRLNEQVSRHNMHSHGRIWISEGVKYIHDDACPFCGQPVKDLDLVKAYKQFFSASYTALIEDIENLQKSVEDEFGDSALAKLGETFAKNESDFLFWQQFTSVGEGKVDHEETIAAPMKAFRAAILNLIECKRKNLFSPVTPGAPFRDAKAEYDEAFNLMEAYNKKVANANNDIIRRKEEIKSTDLAAIEAEIDNLKPVKVRSSSPVNSLCSKHKILAGEKKQLDDDKKKAKKDLDDYTGEVIGNYEGTINILLKRFRAGFSIKNSGKEYIGGKPSSVYQIQINEHPVDLGDANTPYSQHSFRTTLSAGDKSTLALAFFLAQLHHDPQKANRIVIFDDPFNSQDRSRRQRTAELLEEYGEKCAQLLLFSHEPHFLKLVYSRLFENGRRSFRLSSMSGNTTAIKEWDVEKEIRDDHLKDYDALLSYSQGGAEGDINIARKIRPVLEGNLLCRFPNALRGSRGLGNMIGKIREFGEEHAMFSKIRELENINDFSKKYHHPGGNREPIDDDELRDYVERTLEIINE